MPWVSILIVNYRSTVLLKRCLTSIERSTRFAVTETIVVDNASPEFEGSIMAEAFPWVTFLPQRRNLTFTAGTNLAFARATGEHILLLNPDTELEPGALEAAARHRAERPDMAALGAYLMNPDGTLQRYYRRLPTVGDVPAMVLGRFMRHTRRGRRYLMLDESFVGMTPVDQPPGAFLLVSRDRLGGTLLEPGFFNYGSDVELCERLRRGGPILVFDDLRVTHHKGSAGVGTSDARERLRLSHDLTWAVRRLFRQTSRPGRIYVEFWLVVFWLGRIGQAIARRPSDAGLSLRIARRALGGLPPNYDE